MAPTGRRNADSLIVAALAAGNTQEQAATLAGVGVRTVARRVTEPDFRQAVLEARAGMIERATGRLAESTTRAAAALLALLDDESATVRLSAARALLDTAGRYVEAGDTAERIARLEELIQTQLPEQPTPMKRGDEWAA